MTDQPERVFILRTTTGVYRSTTPGDASRRFMLDLTERTFGARADEPAAYGWCKKGHSICRQSNPTLDFGQ